MPNVFSLLRGKWCCRALFATVLVYLDHVSLLVMWTPRNLKLSTCSTTAPSMRMGVCSVSPFPVVRINLLCLDRVEGEVVVLAPHDQVSDLLPIGCLIIVGDQAYRCCVISNINDVVRVVPGRAVMSEQAVQERPEHAPLRGSRVEDQHGRCVVTTFTTWGGPSGSPGYSCSWRC